MYENLTSILPQFSDGETYGKWIVDRTSKGTLDDPIHLPFVNYGSAVLELERLKEIEEA